MQVLGSICIAFLFVLFFKHRVSVSILKFYEYRQSLLSSAPNNFMDVLPVLGFVYWMLHAHLVFISTIKLILRIKDLSLFPSMAGIKGREH